MIQVHYSKTLSFIKGFSIGNNSRRLPCDVDEFSKTDFSASCRVRRDTELDTYDNMSAIYEFYIGKDYLDNVQFEIYAYSTQRRSNNVTLDLPVVSQADISVIGWVCYNICAINLSITAITIRKTSQGIFVSFTTKMATTTQHIHIMTDILKYIVKLITEVPVPSHETERSCIYVYSCYG